MRGARTPFAPTRSRQRARPGCRFHSSRSRFRGFHDSRRVAARERLVHEECTGYSTKQWVGRGRGVRKRRHDYDEVVISCSRKSGAWWAGGTVASMGVALQARRGLERFEILLSTPEVDDVAPIVIACMTPTAREKLVLDLLGQLSDRSSCERSPTWSIESGRRLASANPPPPGARSPHALARPGAIRPSRRAGRGRGRADDEHERRPEDDEDTHAPYRPHARNVARNRRFRAENR